MLPQQKKTSIFSSLPNFTRAGKETFISKIPLTNKTQLLLLQLTKTLSRILLWDFFVLFFSLRLLNQNSWKLFFFFLKIMSRTVKREAGSTSNGNPGDLNQEPREVRRERVTRSRGKSGVEEPNQQMDRRVLRSMYRTLQNRIKGIDYFLVSNCSIILFICKFFFFLVADKRDDLTRHDLDRFNTMIKEVEDLHKFGKFEFFLFSTEFIFIFEINNQEQM